MVPSGGSQVQKNDPLSEPMRFFSTWTGGNCGWCQVLVGVGTITPSTRETFLSFLENSERAAGYKITAEGGYLYLHSPGGDLLGALRFGKEIRARRMYTAVGFPTPVKGENLLRYDFQSPAVCLSACVFLFAAGEHRYYDPNPGPVSTGEHPEWAKNLTAQALGVHQFFSAKQGLGGFNSGVALAQDVASKEIGYLAEMGVRA